MQSSVWPKLFPGLLGVLLAGPAPAQWTAFNDHYRGPGTHPNATEWNVFGTTGGAPGSAGPLKHLATGADLPVTLTISQTGAQGGTAAGGPAGGTPAYDAFNGFVDFGSGTLDHAIQIPSTATVTHRFTGLSPAKRYRFTGTAIRANNYTDRWTTFELVGATAFRGAHSAGCLTSSTPGLPAGGLTVSQAVLNTGDNDTAGDVVVWEDVDPGADGEFSVTSVQYTGTVPGGSSAGSYGYALAALKLEEFDHQQIPAAITNPPQSQAVQEWAGATFTVGAGGNPAPALQWYQNGTPIAGATNATYTIDRVPLSDSGAVFRVVAANTVSNVAHSVTSSPAVLTVTADNTPPVLLSAMAVGLSQVQASFSERLSLATATNPANYAITSALHGPLTILAAALAATETNVLLSVSPLTEDVLYTLIVNQVRDQSAAANPVALNSQATFTAVNYAPQDLGTPAIAGRAVAVPGGFDVTAAGTGLGGSSDQGFLAFQTRSGNFDQCVRVASLAAGDYWAKAGLMARESTAANARFVAILTSPTAAGTFLESRSSAGASSTITGNYPVNYPHTWLRLQRVGNVFTGSTSYDGQSWYQVGAITLALPTTLYFGMAASSRDAAAVATAQFRDLSTVSGATTATGTLPFEPIGPSSRKTGLAITEIMYNPAGAGAYSTSTEFIELYNSNPWFEEIGGYRISGDVDYTFPAGTVLPGGAFLIVARNPAAFTARYGLTNVFGPWDGAATNALPNDAGTVRLRNNLSAVYLEIEYRDRAPWPMGADNTGHSMVLARPSYGENDPRAWARSDTAGGSPGRVDGLDGGPLRNVVINEFLANSELPWSDYLELYNHGNQLLDLAGCTLSDAPDTNKFVFPPHTLIPPRGFLVLTQAQMNFGLEAGGETIYFKNPDGTRVLDAVRYDAQAQNRAAGRFPDGDPEIHLLAARTPGVNNTPAGLFVPDVVINEIMYKPVTADDDDEFVELHNRGANPVNLGDWRFVDGIDFRFPSSATIPPGGYLVVAKNKARLLARYPHLHDGNTVGNFDGTLSNQGERLALAMPEFNVSTNAQGQGRTNLLHVVVSDVTYGSGRRWGAWANEGGSSLELKDARANPRLAGNWAASDETDKAVWVTVEATGPMDHGSADLPNLLEVYLNGEGECLMDNVEVFMPNGPNLVLNSGFEPGPDGWVPRGTHERTTWENTQGDKSGRSLHLRASARGDYGANRILTPLTATPSGTVTIRGRFRWLAGFPEVVMRLHGNSMEATGPLFPPGLLPQLGTPGARNSRAVTNAGPALAAVQHRPVVPDVGQAVVVTAQVQDPDGLAGVNLRYRLDPATIATTVPMLDTGAGGDAVAGDGLFSATIPGQTSGMLVAFYVEAADAAAPAGTARFPEGAPAAGECLVRFGDPTPHGAFFPYRQWLTQSAVNRWSSANRPVLSNEPIEGTFVYGNWRAVYNMGTRYAGSPYHQGFNTPTGNNCHYSIELPRDDMVLGTETFNKIHGPGNGSFDDCTIQREQAAYWIARQAGLPWLYRRHVVMYVNGVRRGTLMEDMQTPNGDVVEEYWPDDADGQLYKLQPWFEMDDAAAGSMVFNNRSWCTLNRYLTTVNGVPGQHKLARYRVNYLTRAAHGTANDYTNVFRLVDAANTFNQGVDTYMANLEALVDTEQWIRTFAVEHACGNWDSFGNRNAQNMYGYKPRNGRWGLVIFDFNIVLNNTATPPACGSGADAAGSQLMQYQTADAAMPYLYHNGQVPAYRRAFWRAMKDVVNGPMEPTRLHAMLDAKYTAFRDHGVTVTAPDGIKAFVAAARSSITSQMAAQDTGAFTLTGSSTITVSSNVVTLTGLAPVEVRTLKVNGHDYPLRWTSTTAWQLQVPVSQASTVLRLQGYDYFDRPVSAAVATVTVHFTGPYPDPATALVLNELMFHPLADDAEYVELYNDSATVTFDLAGWRINGLDYTFPGGAFIRPRGYLVLAKNQSAFARAYGSAVTVFDEFNGDLQLDGETLTLERPVTVVTNGTTNVVWLAVDKVRYESVRPWPTGTNELVSAASFQLVDFTQDNSRPLNWRTAYRPAVWSDPITQPAITNEGWTRYSFTAVAGVSAGTMILYMDTPAAVWLDDCSLVEGTEPEAGVNLLQNGGFESGALSPWVASGVNTSNTTVLAPAAHAGALGVNLQIDGTAGNAQRFQQSVAGLNATNTYTFSFWYYTTEYPATLQFRLSSGFRTGIAGNDPVNLQRNIIPPQYTPPQLLAPALVDLTPGAPNTGRTALTPIPPLWINEVQPVNENGLRDSAGERDPWIEIHNAGTNEVALDNFHLADNYTNLTQWAFPAGATIAPREFKVIFTDGQPNQSTATEWHTSFRLPATAGSIALVRLTSQPEVLDYLNYANVRADASYGAFPDGQPFTKLPFFYVTPGGTNDASAPPVQLYVNEWMADNAGLVRDAADNDTDDWFELYNASPTAVDLAGYYFTDTTNNPRKFQIPPGYVAPGRGFLLVWADEETGQNTTHRPDLHVNFKLAAGGELIGLYSPAGAPVDLVAFTPQTPNVSEGRVPDGAPAPFQRFTTPTPNASNVVGATNTPPVLSPMAARTLTLGQSLTFPATATDADVPPQSLTFLLVENPPAGAAIDAGLGVFTWRPDATQAPGSHPITVQVTDSGTPPASVMQAFTVTVVLPPNITVNRSGGGQISLQFATVPGQRYRVERTGSLTAPIAWTPLPDANPVIATEPGLAITDTLDAREQRFYRVVVTE